VTAANPSRICSLAWVFRSLHLEQQDTNTRRNKTSREHIASLAKGDWQHDSNKNNNNLHLLQTINSVTESEPLSPSGRFTCIESCKHAHAYRQTHKMMSPSFEENEDDFAEVNDSTDNDQNQEQHTIENLRRTIRTMETSNLFLHPGHGHSFQPVVFFLSLTSKCARCQQRLHNVLFGGSQGLVRCVACGVYAHRSCALSKEYKWHTTCQVNVIPSSSMSSDEEIEFVREGDKQDTEDVFYEREGGDYDLMEGAALPSDPWESAHTIEGKVVDTITLPATSASPERNGHSSEAGEDAVEVTPLHYANHPFASVSRALQENIMAHFKRKTDETDCGYVLESADVLAEPQIPADDASAAESSSHPVVKFATGTMEVVRQSYKMSRQLGVATVAGGVAGGVAGLAMAGPAGAMVGYRAGQVCGALGVILEGSVSIGVVVASIATASYTAQHLQDQILERRVLTMGEDGVARKVLLVRPDVQIDPEWSVLYIEARKSAPQKNLADHIPFMSSMDQTSHRRRKSDADIIMADEDEIPTTDKVLLLASRLLNDKTSLPGYVYRHFIQTFRDRCEKTDTRDSPRMRRDDVHAIIKYVTATLLETRPGFGASPALTELTATAVESLVFGELYSLVYEEIAAEVGERDQKLLQKLAASMPITHDETKEALDTTVKAIESLVMLSSYRTPVDKLTSCVQFLEHISSHFAQTIEEKNRSAALCADSLLKMVCHHIVAARMENLNAEVSFLEEFARDEQLLRGKEGYALVTLQASLHFLNMSEDIEQDIFGQDDVEENVPVNSNSSKSASKSISGGGGGGVGVDDSGGGMSKKVESEAVAESDT
jgi:Vacuolar sorting protein 9 (VPS9) domain